MTSEGKNAALFALSLGLILGIPLEASAQANSPQLPKPGSVPVNVVVVDAFDSVSQWSTNLAKGVELTVHADSGQHGSGLRLDFDFHGGEGYALIHREVNLELPADYQFTFAVRGDAPTNTLEFKLVDPTGANVWWSNNRYFVFPREWRTVARTKRQICFAWGPTGDSAPKRYDLSAPGCRLGIDIHRVAAIEFAITAGSGGKGSVWIDDLSVSPLDTDSPHRENPPTDDDAQTQTYFEFQVEKPATMLDAAPMPKYPRELERSGLGGEVQAQFVVMSSGKVDMDSFKVLKSTDRLFTRAVRNWMSKIQFSPAMIGGKAVNQLVQQSFQFAVPR
jgi:TonB family protein